MNIDGKIFDDFEWQECQGMCPECGYYFFKYVNKRTKRTFKYCLGFGSPPQGNNYHAMKKKRGFVVGWECPCCSTKSCFHVPPYWEDEFGKWIEYWLEKSASKP